MKCRDFESIVPDLARNRSDDLAGERALAHAEGCDRCATRLVHEQALSFGVRAVIADIANDEPSPRVETALLTAFNAHFAQKAPTFFSELSGGRPRLSFSLAFVFAMLLILISIPSAFWLHSRSLTRVPEVISQNPSARSIPSLNADPGDEVKTRPGAGSSRRQRGKRPLVVTHPNVTKPNASEEVTEFLPLADGEDLTLLEAAQVVRVELPVSALMDLGLRVGPEISPGQVKADLLLGHDGSARAIRFVR